MLLDRLHVRGHPSVSACLQDRYDRLKSAELIVCQLSLVIVERSIIESPLLTHALLVLELSTAASHIRYVLPELRALAGAFALGCSGRAKLLLVVRVAL